MILSTDMDPFVKNNKLIDNKFFNIVEDNIWHLIERKELEEELIDYFYIKGEKINYLIFEKLKVAEFKLEKYKLIENARDSFKIRLDLINNFKIIRQDKYIPDFIKISSEYLFFIHDNIKICEYIRKLSFNNSLVLKLRYGWYDSENEKFKYEINMLRNILFKFKENLFFIIDNDIILDLIKIDLELKEIKLIKDKLVKVREKYKSYKKLKIKKQKEKIKKLEKQVIEIVKLLIKHLENIENEQKIIEEVEEKYGEKHKLTLEEAGEILDVTRERVRQIQNKAEKKLVNLVKYELLSDYSYIFSFSFDKLFLNKRFYINDLILNNINDFIGELEVSDIKNVFKEEDFFILFKNQFNELEKEYYKLNNYILIDNAWIKKDRRFVTSYIIDNILDNEPYTIEEIGEKYNLYIEKCQLDKYLLKTKKDFKAFGSTLERYGLIKSLKYYRKQRKVSLDEFEIFINTIISEQEDFFSTKLIFEKYNSQMMKYDILDYYELHYIMKNICLNIEGNLTFERTPHITKGPKLEEFLEYNLSTSKFDELDYFLEDIEKRTGISSQTIKGGYFEILDKYYLLGKKVNSIDYTEEILEEIKTKYPGEIYIIEDFSKDLKEYGKEVFQNNNFRFVGNWMISDKFKTIKEALMSQCDEFGITKFTNLSESVKNSNYFKVYMATLRQKLNLIKISQSSYLKINDELKKEIYELILHLREEINNRGVITFWEFENMIDRNKYPLMNKYDFDREFFKNITFSDTSIRYTFDLLHDVHINCLEIIEDYLKYNLVEEFISVEDLKIQLKELRGWDMPFNFLEKIKKHQTIYYSAPLEAFFVNKEKFINYLRNA